MNAINFTGLEMADKIEFALAAVSRILHTYPDLQSHGYSSDFELIREVAGCSLFIDHNDIQGVELTALLPVVAQWIRQHQVGHLVTPAALRIAAIWRGYGFDGVKFKRNRARQPVHP